MKSGSLIIGILVLISIIGIKGRVAVGSDGSLNLYPYGASQTIEIDGELQSQGRGVISEINRLTTALEFVDYMNLYRLSASRWQVFAGSINSYLFSANGNSYLIVSTTSSSILYIWDGDSFVNATLLYNSQSNDWISFSVGGNQYLANSPSTATVPTLYILSGNTFVSSGTIGISGPTNRWGFVNNGTTQYLCQATAAGIDNNIYIWSGSSWTVSFSTAPISSTDCELISYGGVIYASFVYDQGGQTQIFSNAGGSWSSVISIPCVSPTDSQLFSWNGGLFAVIGENKVSGNNTYSEVWSYNAGAFYYQSSFTCNGTKDLQMFQLWNKLYLAVANTYDGVNFRVPSQLWSWNSGTLKFDSITTIPSILSTADWSFVYINPYSYLSLSSPNSTNIYLLNWQP